MTSKTWEEAAGVAARLVLDPPSGLNIDSLDDVDSYLDDWENLTDADFARIGEFALREDSIWPLVDLITAKQYDYGHQNILRHGLHGVVVRMCDKVERIRNLERRTALRAGGNASAMNESLEDSWSDLVGYSIIAIMLLNDTFTLPLAGDQPDAPAEWTAQLYGDQSIGVLKHDAYQSVDLLITNDGQLLQHDVERNVWVAVDAGDEALTWVEFYDDEEPF